MPFNRPRSDRLDAVSVLCRTLCLCATWVRVATALPQGASGGNVLIGRAPAVALIPSAQVTALIPSGPVQSQTVPEGLIPSQPPPPGLIPSQPFPSELIPSQPVSTAPAPLPSGLIPSGLIPSAPGIIPSGPGIIPSMTDSSPPSIQTSIPPVETGGNGSKTLDIPTPSWTSTDEGLKPIPAQTTSQGDPNGHHEVTEPNFTATVPCRGCSPVIEISVSGFFDATTKPAVEHGGSTAAMLPPKATVTAGASQIVVAPAPADPPGNSFVIGDSTTVAVGQTVTIGDTPVVIQTSAGNTNVIVGTETVPIKPNSPESAGAQITDPPSVPILQPVTVAGQIITANGDSQYVVAGQTLQPAGPAITVDGSTISLMPSATAIVVNGVTSTLSQVFGNVYTTTEAPYLTINNQVYTANRVGYYVLGPGITLVPGGSPVTISGTVVSMEPYGTAAIIQGSTSFMTPITTLVTLTEGGGVGGPAYSTGGNRGNVAQSSKHNSAGVGIRVPATLTSDGWLGGLLLLSSLCFGWLAVWL